MNNLVVPVPWHCFSGELEHATERKLRSFAALPDGWNFGRGVPAQVSSLKRALILHRHGIESGFSHSDCFPGDDGEVMVTFYSGDTCLEFTFETDGRIVCVFEENDEEQRETVSQDMAGALQEITDFWKGQWKSYESSVSGNMTSTRSGSGVLPFATPAGMEAFRLSASSV